VVCLAVTGGLGADEDGIEGDDPERYQQCHVALQEAVEELD